MVETDFTIAEALNGAAALIERGWCKINYAQDAAGNRVNEDSPDAVRWCINGALSCMAMRLSRTGASYLSIMNTAGQAVDEVVGQFRVTWNDSVARSPAEVADALRTAADKFAKPVSDTWTKADAYLPDIEQVDA